MKTTIQEQDGKVVAILEGSLDTAAAKETEEALCPLNNIQGKDIVIDCTDLTYISSAGLRTFLRILQNAEQKGTQLYIKNVSDPVREIFSITGFINIFQFK